MPFLGVKNYCSAHPEGGNKTPQNVVDTGRKAPGVVKEAAQFWRMSAVLWVLGGAQKGGVNNLKGQNFGTWRLRQ